MKKSSKIILYLLLYSLLIGTFAGCKQNEEQTRILPYSLSEIKSISVSQNTGMPNETVQKEVTEAEDVEKIYEQLAIVPVGQDDWQPAPESTAYLFIIEMKDRTQYDIKYFAGDKGQGRVVSDAGKFDYYTTADIASIWKILN